MKQKLLLKTMLLLCALIVGSSSVWAQTPRDYSAVYTSNVDLSTSGGTNASTCKVAINQTQYDGIKIGGSNAAGAMKMTIPSGTKYLHLHISGWNDIGTNLSLQVTGITGISNIPVTADSGISGNSPFTLNSTPSSNSYYKTITFSSALTSNTELTFTTSGKKRCIIYGVNAESLPNSVTLKRGSDVVTSLDMTLGGDDVTLSATVAPSNANQNITWTSSNTNVATVSNGVIHALAAGETTITATSTLSTVKATCDVTITAGSNPSAVVSEAELAFGDVEIGHTKVMTFTVTPANLTSTLTIASNNAKYTVYPTSIAQNVTTAQTITVTAAPTALADDMDGTITISGGGLASDKAVTLSASPYQVSTITLSATNGYIQEGGVTKTSITSRVGNKVKVTAIPNSGYAFISWEASGATPASSSTAETEFTLSEAEVTLTANFIVDPKMYVTLTETNIGNMTGKTDYGEVKTITVNGLTWSSDGYKQSSNNQYVQLKSVSSGSPYIKLPNIPGYIQTITFTVTNATATSSSGTAPSTTFKFRTSATGSDIVSAANSGNTLTLDLSGEETKYSTGYIVSNAGARVWEITIAYIPTVNLNAACNDGVEEPTYYGTYSNGKAFIVPDDGYTVSAVSVSDGKLVVTNYQPGSVVKANTGVMVSSKTSGNHIIALSIDEGSEIDGNMLMPVVSGITANEMTAASASGTKFYRLTMHGGTKLGFWWGAQDGGAFAITGTNKAYLAVPANAAPAMGFGFGDDETTGIGATLNDSVNDNVIYDLSGRRVTNPTKGLYIMNGKKVVIK